MRRTLPLMGLLIDNLAVGFLAAFGLLTGLPGSALAGPITTVAYYRLGEADLPTGVPGNPGNPVTVDSSGNGNNLALTGSATYAPALAPFSTVSMGFSGSGFYSRAAFGGITDNFMLEGYFNVSSVLAPFHSAPFYNGNPGSHGFGFEVTDGKYQGLYGGVAYLSTGQAEIAGDTIYMALVRDMGDTRVYFSRNGGPLTAYDFGNIGPNPVSGGDQFSIGDPYLPSQDHLPFKGSIDETRLSIFAPGTFSTGDLLVNTTPEPSTMVLMGLAGGILVVWHRRTRKAPSDPLPA